MARPLRLAHRGDWRRSPENSLAAIVAAVRLPGVDGVEFDVRAAADGKPVVIHDATLARTHGDRRAVAELDSVELAALGVPALETVLAATGSDAFLDVELKEDVAEATIDRIARARRAPGRTVVSSFDPAVVRRCAATDPGLPRWLNARSLARTVLEEAALLACSAVCVEHRAVTSTRVARAARLGLGVACFTVRRRTTRQRVERLGVLASCVEGAALEP